MNVINGYVVHDSVYLDSRPLESGDFGNLNMIISEVTAASLAARKRFEIAMREQSLQIPVVPYFDSSYMEMRLLKSRVPGAQEIVASFTFPEFSED